MLILQRRTGESVVIGEDVRISVVSIEGGRVRLAISAPPEVSILRSELLGLLGGMPVSPSKKHKKGESRNDE